MGLGALSATFPLAAPGARPPQEPNAPRQVFQFGGGTAEKCPPELQPWCASFPHAGKQKRSDQFSPPPRQNRPPHAVSGAEAHQVRSPRHGKPAMVGQGAARKGRQNKNRDLIQAMLYQGFQVGAAGAVVRFRFRGMARHETGLSRDSMTFAGRHQPRAMLETKGFSHGLEHSRGTGFRTDGRPIRRNLRDAVGPVADRCRVRAAGPFPVREDSTTS